MSALKGLGAQKITKRVSNVLEGVGITFYSSNPYQLHASYLATLKFCGSWRVLNACFCSSN